jgi:hypothetical protein
MKLRNWLLSGYVAVFALMIIVASVTYQGTHGLIRNQGTVDHAHQIKTLARLTMHLVLDIRLGESMRGDMPPKPCARARSAIPPSP